MARASSKRCMFRKAMPIFTHPRSVSGSRMQARWNLPSAFLNCWRFISATPKLFSRVISARGSGFSFCESAASALLVGEVRGRVLWRCWPDPTIAQATIPAASAAGYSNFQFRIREILAPILPFCERLCRSYAFFFFYRDDLIGAHVFQLVHLPAGPANFDRLGLRVHSQPEGQRQFARRKITRSAAKSLRLDIRSRRDPYVRADAVAV